MRTEHIEAIRKACIAANPKLSDGDTLTLTIDGATLHATVSHAVRLADVLLAIWQKQSAKKTLITLESDGQFVEHWYNFSSKQSKVGPTWNLRTDDLTQQPDETIAFIHSLIGV